ncbi:hypothetical protein PAMP_011196 [Pampus punctatissimus]
MVQRRRTDTQPVEGDADLLLSAWKLGMMEERKERGAALPLTAHRRGLRLCRRQRAEQRRKGGRGGGGGALLGLNELKIAPVAVEKRFQVAPLGGDVELL